MACRNLKHFLDFVHSSEHHLCHAGMRHCQGLFSMHSLQLLTAVPADCRLQAPCPGAGQMKWLCGQGPEMLITG